MLDNLVKSPFRTFYSAGKGFPLSPFEVNSNGSTLTLGRSLSALGPFGLFTRPSFFGGFALGNESFFEFTLRRSNLA
jgi:hypothetical protein